MAVQKTNGLSLYNVQGISRHSGTDADGSDWLEQFLGEMEDSAIDTLYECEECPNCDGDISEIRDREKCPNCGESMYQFLMPVCDECGKRITSCDAFFCLDDGNTYVCERCVELHEEAEPEPDPAVELAALAKRLHVELDSDGKLPSYAWLGGYQLIYYSADGSTYCPDCASQGQAEPPITMCEVYEEGPDISCDGCGKTLESSYGDPDAEPEEEQYTCNHAGCGRTSKDSAGEFDHYGDWYCAEHFASLG